jgi:hypothetical protein
VIKRALVAAACALGVVTVTSAPAHAIPPNPLIVTDYFNGNGDLVGQKWRSCGEGQWGVQTSHFKIRFIPCNPE